MVCSLTDIKEGNILKLTCAGISHNAPRSRQRGRHCLPVVIMEDGGSTEIAVVGNEHRDSRDRLLSRLNDYLDLVDWNGRRLPFHRIIERPAQMREAAIDYSKRLFKDLQLSEQMFADPAPAVRLMVPVSPVSPPAPSVSRAGLDRIGPMLFGGMDSVR